VDVRRIEAARRVPKSREALYQQLAHLPGHWELAGRWVEPVELNHDGGIVRVKGPFGLHRTIRTDLTELREPECVAGEARLGRTLAAIRWDLEAAGPDSTVVTLSAEVRRAGGLDAILLKLGGAHWLRSRFAATLQRLG
jgi:hypothetical protein